MNFKYKLGAWLLLTLPSPSPLQILFFSEINYELLLRFRNLRNSSLLDLRLILHNQQNVKTRDYQTHLSELQYLPF
jgi:hypothetical protein